MARDAARVIVALVGCGKSKRAVRSRAEDLYTGGLFKLARRWAELEADRWFILSARHGAVAPEVELEPYETSMADLTRAERLAWGERVRATLAPLRVDGARFVALAGRAYVNALGMFGVEDPMTGLGIGRRLAWLKREVG